MLIIIKFSLENGEKSSQTSNEVVDIVVEMSPSRNDITPIQKESLGITIRQMAHFCIYLLLGFCFANAFRCMLSEIMPYPFLLALASSLQFSLFDEFVLQASTSGRAAEWKDIFTDLLGAIFGVAVYAIMILALKLIFKITKRKS